MAGWRDTLAAAQKIIGKDGKLPRPAVDPGTTFPVVNKGFEAFDVSRSDLEKKLVGLEDALSKAKHALQQYYDMVDGEDFGLDTKDPEDKKKIDAAVKLLLGFMKEQQTNADVHLDRLSKLDRVLVDLRRFDALKP